MIICDRCKCEVTKELVECLEVKVINDDETYIKPEANIWRFCNKCWEEITEFLLGEGML